MLIERARIISELKQIIMDECDPSFVIADITDDVRLIGEGLAMDSLDALQISLAVKDHYGVRIESGPDARLAFASVSALADFILERRSGL